MKRVAFGMVLIAMLLTASSVLAIDVMVGEDYFLRTPLYAAEDKDNQIDWINYSDVSEKLKAGERITIIEVKGHTIKFLLNKKVFNFAFTKKGLGGTSGIYDKYFTAEDIKEEVAKYSDQIRNNIAIGRVELGMTKEQVLLAAGCPAVAGERKTYNLSLDDIMQSNNWLYYRSRLKKMFLKFADGKVESVEE